MSSFFDEFFYKYCQLEFRAMQDQSSMRSNAWCICWIALGIVFLSGIMISLTHCECLVHSVLGWIIILCVVAILVRANVLRNRLPSTQVYSSHISEVVSLLAGYHIYPNESDKIKELIDYSKEAMKRRNPLLPIAKVATCAGSVIAIVWAVLANSLNSTSDFVNYVGILGNIAICILAGSLIIFVAWNLLLFIVFPEQKKYLQLIDDLKQIAIFYRGSDNSR